MDGIEIARRRAAEINRELIAKGSDITKPYQLALAAADAAGVEVQKVDRGSPMLNGARAIYDPTTPLILHEATGSDFDDAFLVAHEVGHVQLGDRTQRDEARHIDPSRPSEMPPVGAERVEDYSRRQRREVQIDLFARELLLPRATAKALHVQSAMTSEDLARMIGAPRAAIVQQLLDALLLPEADPDLIKVPVERLLNEKQKEAAEHWGEPYLLEAGPGTGKTQTLVGRVAWLLAKGVDPRSILVLTFSNKAAGELFDRIAALDGAAAAAMWIGTFHSFGLDLIRRFHDRLGLPDDPKMIDRADAIGLLEVEAPKLDLHHYKNLWDPTENLDKILAAISRAKDELAGPLEFERLVALMAAAAETEEARVEAEKQAEVARVYKRYEEIKGAMPRLDFGDLVTLPVKLLTEHGDVRSELSVRYAHVLVDEYQDVNRSSVELLRKLRPTGKHLWAVGDAKQSIYRFRGASSVNLANFAKDFLGAKDGRLTINYRSTGEIVTTFSKFAEEMNVARGKDSSLEADRGGSGHVPEHRQVDYAADEMEAVAEAIEAFRAEGIDYRDQAILCTGNDKLAKFGAALESLGIPVLHLGSIFERPEIKDLLSILSMLVDGRAMGIVRAATMPQFAMGIADAAHVIQSLAAGTAPEPAWSATAEQLPGLTAGGRIALGEIGKVMAGFDEKSQPWDVLSALLLDRTRIAADLGTGATIASRAKSIAIWQLMNFVRNPAPGRGLPIVRLLDRIRRLVRLADERDLRQLPASAQGLDAVRLMTIHGSKGLEFRAIHFPGVNSNSLPRSPNMFQGIETADGLIQGLEGTGKEMRHRAHVDEQECLFYVAMSRARDRLTLYTPTKNAAGSRWGHSEYIDRIVPPATRVHIDPAMELPPEDAGRVDIVFEGAVSIGDTKLATYDSCPRRFYYSYLLEVGGKRFETTFMKMHDAVQLVVDWMVKEAPDQVDPAEVDRRLGVALEEIGVSANGYAEEYRAIAETLIAKLVESRAGMTKVANPGIVLNSGPARIDVRVDDILEDAAGRMLVRRVRTGHATKKSQTDAASTSFFFAAQESFPGSTIEVVHLADRDAMRIEIDPKKLAARRAGVDRVVSAILTGHLPPERSSRSCPRCPAFFICGSLPPGTLVKKASDGVTGSA
ncbi:ATP-dependent helicase [Mesorhizobium sp.]|uniref:ATP-dependent helicase n=4 Tax=unclassified Mesorhizobium TaxID=325217 RepID=UPI000FE9E271|nr:ATP-dependent helicase [Mesorhizobium sp.]RWK51053.1 MAG: ImmA/IrrE family metallo-endopeptidase [Mesorhizobium sp.]TIM84305.1 MAG: ImmA/IrrE family metallo-endopeptidase [Mesorhizobium sp.]TIP41199.1 MAG: ImmA/IrrE family metallo-endopeptidase [Mesorhizobium sp.]